MISDKKIYLLSLSRFDIGLICGSLLGIFYLGKYSIKPISSNKVSLETLSFINNKHSVKIFQNDKNGKQINELFIKYIPEYMDGKLIKIVFPNHMLQNCTILIKHIHSQRQKYFSDFSGNILEIENSSNLFDLWSKFINFPINTTM